MTEKNLSDKIKSWNVRSGNVEDKVKKTMLFEKELHDKIMKLAEQNDRDFTKQVKYMLKEYMRIKEKP